jgi:hypothetical protein
LLKFARDRRAWIRWLFEARKRYGLEVLNYTVTSSHIHLLVYSNHDREAVPRALQLVAGRVGVEDYIQKGAKQEKTWTEAIAAGSAEFVESVKTRLGIKAKHRRIHRKESAHKDTVYALQELLAAYRADFGRKNVYPMKQPG